MEKLVDILSFRRQHNSSGEAAFIAKYLSDPKFVQMKNHEGQVLAYRVDLYDSKLTCNTMWSSHIDTMHRGKDEVLTQEVFVDAEGTAFVESTSCCLGADDGAGVWLMLEMITNGVPGVYVFHRGEETGCWGSKQIEGLYPEWLAGFTHAIAFDRRDNCSIITHQMGTRACSDELGLALIDRLGLGHELDPTGSYTDTAQYMDAVAECVNISIGYMSEHGSKETCDVSYVMRLKDAICAVTDWELPVVRDPATQVDDDYVFGTWGAWGGSGKKLNVREAISSQTLRNVKPQVIIDYCREARPEVVSWTIEDLLQDIMELEAQLEKEQGIRFGGEYDDYDDFNMHDAPRLPGGMQ